MALHARLVAPPPEPRHEWPWHQAKWSAIPCNVLWQGDRRMEAETYLSAGRGLRVAIEGHPGGWIRFDKMARVTMPNRTKATLVSSDFGTPFLAATQVFDIRPYPRKWLAIDKIDFAQALLTKPGMILVTRSGAVGRTTLATVAHDGKLISDDLLRIEPLDDEMWGWVYAYLRSPQARAIMVGAHYGHIIKHLETTHLDAMPIPIVRPQVVAGFKRTLEKILDLRNCGYRLALEAETRFERMLGALKVKDWGETGFSAHASTTLFGKHHRLEAAFHNPGVTAIWKHLAKNGKGFLSIGSAGFNVWSPGRYKRIPAEDGVIYYDSADLLEVCPDSAKRFADCRFGDDFRGRVKNGWLLVPCSGQVYGIIGSVVMAGISFDGQVVSNHVMRIAPKPDAKIRNGYLLTALSHPLFGRPLVKALAFGSSVPELDPEDLRNFEIVRLTSSQEDAIADLAEESASKRAQADMLERELAADAGKLIDCFLAGDMREFAV